MAGKFCPDPRLVFVLWRTGKYGHYAINCGRWDCEVCRREKFDSIALHLASVVTGPVWSGEIAPVYSEAARRAAKRGKEETSYLALSLVNEGVYIVASSALRGRGWRLEETGLKGVICELGGWERARPKYTAWRGWPSLTEEAEEKERTLFVARVRSFPSLERLTKRAGLGGMEGVTEDPDGAALRLERAQKAIENPQVRRGKVVINT